MKSLLRVVVFMLVCCVQVVTLYAAGKGYKQFDGGVDPVSVPASPRVTTAAAIPAHAASAPAPAPQAGEGDPLAASLSAFDNQRMAGAGNSNDPREPLHSGAGPSGAGGVSASDTSGPGGFTNVPLVKVRQPTRSLNSDVSQECCSFDCKENIKCCCACLFCWWYFLGRAIIGKCVECCEEDRD